MFRHKKRSAKPVVFMLFSICIILLLCGSFAAYQWYNANLKSYSTSTEVIDFVVAEGDTVKTVGDKLKNRSLIKSSEAFRIYFAQKGLTNSLKAGTYELSASMNVANIAEILTSGREKSTKYTIGPGQRLDQIKARMIAAGYDQAAVDNALQKETYRDHAVYSYIPKEATLEGFVFPETFYITENSGPEDIIRASLDELDEILSNEMKQSFAAKGLNVYQALTLGSIIEKELPSQADRDKAAQVFYSRLNEGIPLGADATYIYAAKVFGGEPFPELDSPYNTRKVVGLPPGPISNVSLSSLKAVANPADTDYLFYVTGDDGTNHFSKTADEHEANVTRYCTITCAPGYIAEE